MSKGGGQVQETAQQRAFADVARARLQDFQVRWQPVLQNFAKGVLNANEAGSFQRKRAAGMVTTDNDVAYAKANEGLTDVAAQTGTLGSSRQKLAVTGMGADQAVSTGLGKVAAAQAGDNAYVSGLGAVTALGRGEKATAVSGMAQEAALSGQQAQADADASLQNAIGNTSLASRIIGTGFGLSTGGPGGGVPGTNDLPGVNGTNAMDQWLKLGSGGD